MMVKNPVISSLNPSGTDYLVETDAKLQASLTYNKDSKAYLTFCS